MYYRTFVCVWFISVLPSCAPEVRASESTPLEAIAETLGTDGFVHERHIYVGGVMVENAGLTVTIKKNADRALKALGGLPKPDIKAIRMIRLKDSELTDAGVQSLQLLTSLESFRADVWTDKWTAALASLTSIQSIELQGTEISGASLKEIAKLPKVERLMLHDIEFAAGDLHTLRDLKTLKQLSLSSPQLDDDDFRFLQELPNIRVLMLQDTGIADAGLKHIETCKSLELLNVRGTKVTAAAAGALQKKFPKALIFSDD